MAHDFLLDSNIFFGNIAHVFDAQATRHYLDLPNRDSIPYKGQYRYFNYYQSSLILAI